MIEKLEKIKKHYTELAAWIAAPENMKDMDGWREAVKEHASLERIVSEYDRYLDARKERADCETLFQQESDPEMREMFREECAAVEGRLSELEQSLKTLLLPKDPNDDRDIILEIRAGTGGEEASLFAGDLLRMYLRYAERGGYTTEFISSNMTELGGVKEVILTLGGKRGAYSRLKYESGVHRVQRVPETESQGRIQTSAATVAVLPSVDDVQIDLKDTDLRIDIYRSSGAGGQHVNKTESAIRITHIPTGIVVQCQDERSQYKNKDKAMRVLKSRVYDYYQSKQSADVASKRKSMVGSGDRSERIRTYNFPQGRVTDHRINMTLYKLTQFMDGEMDELIDALILQDRADRLSAEGDGYENGMD